MLYPCECKYIYVFIRVDTCTQIKELVKDQVIHKWPSVCGLKVSHVQRWAGTFGQSINLQRHQFIETQVFMYVYKCTAKHKHENPLGFPIFRKLCYTPGPRVSDFKTCSSLHVGRELETRGAPERTHVDSSLALRQEALKSLLPDMISRIPGYWAWRSGLRSLCSVAWSSHSLIQCATKSSNLPC